MTEPALDQRPPWLRRADQLGVAVLLLAGFVGIAAWWLAHGGHRGGLIDIERAEPRHARFEVDLNSAEWPELAQVPGIGEALARRIIESREVDGPYLDHDDLQRVRGIGPRTIERMRPYLRPMPREENVAGP
ncbi:MAG: helix-hairpin-helix domain-containing protein [Pirellulales bacterium]|nr:helix-hairpin-helix domain-containing protein [Pirellulales bacterium]